MGSPDGLTDISDRQLLYSTYYVCAIVGAAGFNIGKTDLDRDSSDVQAHYRKLQGPILPADKIPARDCLHIQIKCTYSNDIARDGNIHYQLKKKNYEDLRADNTWSPYILVVVLVPRPNGQDTENWVATPNNHTIMNYRAYWHSLMGEPTRSDAKKITVLISEKRLFDIRAVRYIMHQTVFLGRRTL